MAAITTAIALAASAAAAAVKANQAKKAAQGAANAQNAALDQVKPIDIPAIQDQAKQADLSKYTSSFDLLNKVDPATGQLRDAANTGLNNSIDSQNSQNSNALLQQLFGENVNLDPNDAAFASKLKAEAARQLDLGGQLSPEQQAEFVRAGLENGAGAGFQAGSSALKQGVGKLLASEQEALQNNRQQMAQQLFGFATNLNNNRISNLTNLAGASTSADNAQFGKLYSLANLADSRVPDIGLGGSDVANLAVANQNQANSVALQKGGVATNQINANAAANSTLAGSLLQLPGQYMTATQQAKLNSSINGAKIAQGLIAGSGRV